MNAPRHDPEALKAALDAFLDHETQELQLKEQLNRLSADLNRLRTRYIAIRDEAADALKKEGGRVVHNGQFWKLEDTGRVSHEDASLNLDAIEAVRRGEPVALTLTSPTSKAA